MPADMTDIPRHCWGQQSCFRKARIFLVLYASFFSRQKNQAMAKAQLDLKREQGKVQQELKDKLFAEAEELVREFMKTADYDAFLVKCIRSALDFAAGEEMTLYINPSDADKKERLERETGTALTVSAEDFTGGMRAVLRGRNILIDHSFKAALANEYDKFVFSGGDDIG